MTVCSISVLPQEDAMSDNLKIRQPQDPTKINVHESWELDYWSKKFGVSKDKLVQAVDAVGPLVAKVKQHLGV
jgi:hypothetical protein